MIALPYHADDTLKAVLSVTDRQTDGLSGGQTDRQTKLLIASPVSTVVLTGDKN